MANNEVTTENTDFLKPVKSNLDDDGNEISPWQKRFAGMILFSAMASCIAFIIGHWPDRMPDMAEHIEPYYSFQWFHVTLKNNIAKTGKIEQKVTDTVIQKTEIIQDSGKAHLPDTSKTGTKAPLGKSTPASQQDPVQGAMPQVSGKEDLIHLNTLLLILVAVGGFLGNMIYITSSFSTYIGSGQYRKSWALWYWLKPLTASGLALAIYFIFRGGFLNMSDNSVSINLYGVMTLSILTGLFTDRATLKLKEVFEVLLRPQEPRPDGLRNNIPKIKDIKADPLEVGKSTSVVLNGSSLKAGKVSISIEGQVINTFNIQEDSITFAYTLPNALAAKESVQLSVKFADDQIPQTFVLKVKPS